MDLILLLEMIVAAVAAALIYTIIGIIPGTDETAVLVPVTLILVLAGIQPVVVLCFFISAVIANNLMDAVPAAIAGIPGGVMASPLIEHAQLLKRKGMADQSLRKMAAGSLIGVLVSVPVSLLLSLLLAKNFISLAEMIKDYANPIFFAGAVLLALLSKNKLLALVSILPFTLLIEGLRYLYWGIGVVPKGTTVFISFFLGITIGPVILTLFELMDKEKREHLRSDQLRTIALQKMHFEWKWFNPFSALKRREWLISAGASLISCFTFILSPVGMTTLLGELFSKRTKDPVDRASIAVSSMNALANATYLSGTLIPLIALGIPLSPVAIGPAHALFDAPPVFTATHNMYHVLSHTDFILATVIGAGVAILVAYSLAIKYAQSICSFVFKRIPHEAILGLFCAFVFLLAYMDAGWINIGGVLLIGLISGMLHRLGVGYGILFMVLYAAPWLVSVF
ncbi:tripartite tricarboxylate transporter permease [Sporolactobacillus shoreicorticis]|uniref:Tripartite tricarboxylate transporter permease n=1 Tax=Sporolactobacillus shoreicorticis TaxID=1923877 RepID=A0ABW5S0J5_9BACL|nr:tripartite tricarboxylate transporter permease [Sporolactobacillus shoreicorticis]MCO7125177.1 tripartite tricarboxylate transporter permease [Sporolactobacillus shoreicorticis]